MRNIDLFSKLLGLDRPWKVTRVSLSPEEKTYRCMARPLTQRVFCGWNPKKG